MSKGFLFFLIFFIVLLLLSGSFLGYNLYALHSLHVQDVVLKQVSVADNLRLHLALQFTIVNPSFVDVTIRDISYQAFLPLYQQDLFSGVLAGQTIPARGSAVFFVDDDLSWIPDLATLLDIMKHEHLPATIATTTTVDYLGFPLKSDATMTLDLAPYLAPVLQSSLKKLSGFFASFR